jgi:hypothetical protein
MATGGLTAEEGTADLGGNVNFSGHLEAARERYLAEARQKKALANVNNVTDTFNKSVDNKSAVVDWATSVSKASTIVM